MACVKNCDSPNIKDRKNFEQPIWQTLNMFAGETLCLILASVCAFLAEKYGRAKWAEMVLDEEDDDILAVVESDGLIVPPASHGHGHGNKHDAPSKKKKLEGKYVFLLWLPTLCDMTASTVSSICTACSQCSLRFTPFIFSLQSCSMKLLRIHESQTRFMVNTVVIQELGSRNGIVASGYTSTRAVLLTARLRAINLPYPWD